MSISLLDNLSIKKQAPDVERQLFNDVDEMVAFSTNYLPDVYECNVKSTGARYRFDRNNHAYDAQLGYWKLVSGSQLGDLEASEDEDTSYVTSVEIADTLENIECTKTVTTVGNEITTIVTANADSSDPDTLKAGDIVSIVKEINGIVVYEYYYTDNETIVSPFD